VLADSDFRQAQSLGQINGYAGAVAFDLFEEPQFGLTDRFFGHDSRILHLEWAHFKRFCLLYSEPVAYLEK
jgi:hypothetical protein